MIYLLSLSIGIVAGLRAMTAPAAVSWAAYLGWLKLDESILAKLKKNAPMPDSDAALSIADISSGVMIVKGQTADMEFKMLRKTPIRQGLKSGRQ